MSLNKFLEKHAVELGTIANVLAEIVNLLPIGSQDKRQLGDKIGLVATAAVNIAESVTPAVKEAKTVIKELKNRPAKTPAPGGNKQAPDAVTVNKTGGPKA